MRPEDHFTAVGPDGAPVSNMIVASAAMLGLHNTARQAVRNRAYLWGWVAAREHGISVKANDAIVAAALTGLFGLMAEWASGDNRGYGYSAWTPESGEPPIAPEAFWRVQLPDSAGYLTLMPHEEMATQVANAIPGSTVLPPVDARIALATPGSEHV